MHSPTHLYDVSLPPEQARWIFASSSRAADARRSVVLSESAIVIEDPSSSVSGMIKISGTRKQKNHTMADTALMKLEGMLPEATYFIEKGIFSDKEMKRIMDERRVLELAVNSRAATLRDYMSYINHEIRTECERRERFEKLNIKKTTARDFSIVQRIHALFNRCIFKYSADVSVWLKYIEFCSTSGSSNALSKIVMKAIKRHPRVASFRILAADRELQQGSLIAARKLLMRAVRIKTDNQLAVWQQLLKLECTAIYKLVTSSSEEGASPSCGAAGVVFKHALRDLASVGKAETFRAFAREAVEALEMSILGFQAPKDLPDLHALIRQ